MKSNPNKVLIIWSIFFSFILTNFNKFRSKEFDTFKGRDFNVGIIITFFTIIQIPSCLPAEEGSSRFMKSISICRSLMTGRRRFMRFLSFLLSGHGRLMEKTFMRRFSTTAGKMSHGLRHSKKKLESLLQWLSIAGRIPLDLRFCGRDYCSIY